MEKIDPSEITPKRLYLSRRQFIGTAGATIAGALTLAACQGNVPTPGTVPPSYTGPTMNLLLARLRLLIWLLIFLSHLGPSKCLGW